MPLCFICHDDDAAPGRDADQLLAAFIERCGERDADILRYKIPAPEVALMR